MLGFMESVFMKNSFVYSENKRVVQVFLVVQKKMK
jgi:hypothetical protein